MILVIDNYDSFTYNLVQLLGRFTKDIAVVRNDKTTTEQIKEMRPDRILISPGPGRPENAGVSVAAICGLGAEIPILGVCLGHQAIGYVFGAEIAYAPSLMHGKVSSILHEGKGVFLNAPSPFIATRYHSLVIGGEHFPKELEITARTADGVIMGVRHRALPIEGVQFHPESVLTEAGPLLIQNWIERKL